MKISEWLNKQFPGVELKERLRAMNWLNKQFPDEGRDIIQLRERVRTLKNELAVCEFVLWEAELVEARREGAIKGIVAVQAGAFKAQQKVSKRKKDAHHRVRRTG